MKTTQEWLTFRYKLSNKLLTVTEINLALIKFNNLIFSTYSENQFILIIFKIRTDENIIRSISTLQRVNKLSINDLKNVFIEYWELKADNYLQFNIEEIILNYKIISDEKENTSTIINRPAISKPRNFYNLLNIGAYNFPMTMDLFEWGGVDFVLDDKEAIVYKRYSSAIYHVKFLKNNKMQVQYRIKNKTLITFTDELLDINNLGTFKRTIKNQAIYFKDGKLDYKEKFYNFPLIQKLNPKAFLIEKFLVMDIETYKDNGILIPYAVSIYNGEKYDYFYLSDYENSTQMLITAVKSLMLRKYDSYKVYLHNFSHFDGVFLLDILNQLSENIEPQINDGIFKNIKFYYNNRKYKLYFRDSLIMLPASLEKLANQFNVESKGIFPHEFVSNNLNYEGAVPDFKYFNKINSNQYREYCAKYTYVPWNLKKESEIYCNKDCKVLYDILSIFLENFNITRVNGSKYVSLSALALANFRAFLWLGM